MVGSIKEQLHCFGVCSTASIAHHIVSGMDVPDYSF